MTGIFILVTIVFILMTAFPFLLSLGIPGEEERGTLVVKSDNRRNPRYFAVSFKEIVQKAMENSSEDGVLQLSKPEQFVYPDEIKDKTVDRLVVCRADFVGEEPLVLEKELYSGYNVELAENTQARAVSAERLRPKRNCRIMRWCDGESEAFIEPECNLGVSATSAVYLQVMEKCTFQRLYAPQVDVIAESEDGPVRLEPDADVTVEIPGECKDVERNVRVISSDSIIKGDVITKHPLYIEDGARILGHVKSRKSIYIENNVVIDGNVFADDSIVLQENCHVTGDLFSQQDVYVGPHCVIGQKGKTKSVIAKSKIFLCEDVTVFGYIGCDDRGQTLTREAFERLPQIQSNGKEMVK